MNTANTNTNWIESSLLQDDDNRAEVQAEVLLVNTLTAALPVRHQLYRVDI